MIVQLVKLIAAHLLGDFMLQSNRLSRMKYESDKYKKISVIGLHSLIQAALSYLFLWEWHLWIVPLVIFVSHFIIDYLKVLIVKKQELISFVVDQLLHYCVIVILWWLVFVKNGYCHLENQDTIVFWLIFTSYILILSPSSILIKSFMDYEKWTPSAETDNTRIYDNTENVPERLNQYKGLPNAGKWIGYIERILILTFIFTGNIEGVGFLLAAKSVFRFGELNKAQDIKVTEYVLIGTFASFCIAIIIGFLAKWLIENI